MKPETIAIDGPAGAGKSTVARMVAGRLGFVTIDSGAMYRAAALHALRCGVDPANEDPVAALVRTTPIEFRPGEAAQSEQRVFLGGDDVSDAIRTPEIASLASVVSAIPGVRAALVAQQQALGASGGVVMEGRDIGTVVFPHAEVKIFLTASADERAARRYADLIARGSRTTLDAVRADQDERDRRDATRDVSPLRPAPDAHIINSDGLSPEQIADEIVRIADARKRGHDA